MTSWIWAMSFPVWGNGEVEWEDAAYEIDEAGRLVGVYRREDAE